MSDVLSIVYPHEAYQSSCGYCGPQGERSKEETSYHIAALTAIQLSGDVGPRPGRGKTFTGVLQFLMLCHIMLAGVPEDGRPRLEEVRQVLL